MKYRVTPAGDQLATTLHNSHHSPKYLYSFSCCFGLVRVFEIVLGSPVITGTTFR